MAMVYTFRDSEARVDQGLVEVFLTFPEFAKLRQENQATGA
jgi:hypothetical protein